MAAYTVASTDVGKYEIALAANVEDIVTFGGAAADTQTVDLDRVEILHHSGASPIYVRLGATATVGGDNCYIVLPGTSINVEPPTSGDTAVHVKSAATAVYSVANGG